MKEDRFQELARLWLKRAKEDYLWAKDSFDDGHFSGVCFLCQQVAEKSLKAFLFSKKERLVKSHSLERLLERVLVYNAKLLKLKKNCQILSQYYVDTRYPDVGDFERFQDKRLALEALGLTEEVLNELVLCI